MRDATGRMTYAVEEVAVLLGVSRTTMYELVAAGQVASVRLGRRIVILRPTVAALVGCDPPTPAELCEILASKQPRLSLVETTPTEPSAEKRTRKPANRGAAASDPRLFG